MSDRAVRDLERAFLGGDAAALPLLVAAHLRRGERGTALALLGAQRALGPDLLALEAEGWRGALRRLAPVQRIPGVRPYAGLWGWVDDQRACLALRRAPTPREGWTVAFLDRASAALEEAPRLVRWFGPVTDGGIIVGEVTPGNGELAAPVLLGPAPGEPRREPLGPITAARVAGAEPGARSLVWTRQLPSCGDPGDVLWTDWAGVPRLTVRGPLVAFGPARSRLVYQAGSELRWLYSGEPLEEARSLEVPGLEHDLITPLGAGLLVARSRRQLRLIDLDARSVTPVGRGTQRASWPFALARDRTAVLGLAPAGPQRLEIGTSRGAPEGPEHEGRACWHPRADAVLLVPESGPAELLAWDGRRFARLLRFPPDARPLGWSPDGRALLVVRRVGEGGLLEVWEARS